MRVHLEKDAPKTLTVLLLILVLLMHTKFVLANEVTEYRLKTAFIYNFAAFTTWPDDIEDNLVLCFYGEHSYGDYLHHIRHKQINKHNLVIKDINDFNDLAHCHVVFISRYYIATLRNIINQLENKSILTLADNPGAIQEGIMLNMRVSGDKIVFDVNLKMVRKAGLRLGAALLRLASEVYE